MSEAGLSLNEVEALAGKAARGAGLAWGEAEDVGRAARWLARHGFDWAAALLSGLEQPEGLRAALALADAASLNPQAGETAVRRATPLWALAFTAAAGRPRTSLVCGDLRLSLAADGTAAASHERDAIAAWPAGEMRIGADAEALPIALAPAAARATPDRACLARLDGLAAETYVPASARSRARGAGSAKLDDD